MRGLCVSALVCGLALVPGIPADGPPAPAGPTVDYSRDVRPILADKCYACHGPDEKQRKAKLRLDIRDEAVKEVIVPGKATDSWLLERVTSTNPRAVMPPPASKKGALTPQQVDLIRRWIDQGAKFDQHWAYVPPRRPAVPAAGAGWARNPIDRFLAAGYAAHGLQPAAEADRVTLLRRLHFDLVGLPPTPEEVDAFLKDTRADAYEQLVERLLASPHYGERMAILWLDLVRYADTAGYHSDNHRDVWLYRDWVINAFNQGMPFDRFTTEQLAGDLLPNPTADQRIASGYNRLLMTTEEGGAQPKEYTAKYAADRVRNLGEAWLGSTTGCCECHDHKYDPFKTRDFYRLAAFFADVQEKAVGRQDQTPFPSPEQAACLKKLDQELAALRPRLTAAQAAWEKETRAGLLAAKPPAASAVPADVAAALTADPPRRTKQQQERLAKHFRDHSPALASVRERVAELEAEQAALRQQIPTTLVTTAGPPRTVRVLPRGNWLDDSGEAVTPDVPAFLVPLNLKDRRANRLDLAKWLVSRDNPLVARVFVNRLWKLTFGQGLVRTMEDFGTQGALPTHPELLDWLAVEFVESGWDVKHVLRLVVRASAYRQSSATTPATRERDPTNQWLARQGRFRLDAELVRDNALAVSGLLTDAVGGPSVKPYAPAGYWSYLNFPTRQYVADKGPAQYRRGLYAYWCRTFAHPSLLAFDAPTREECTADRPRSSTPLQALALLNDPSYVEAARAFAAKALKEGGAGTPERLIWMYRRALSRVPQAAEAKVLTELLEKHRAQYRADPAAAKQLLAEGEAPAPKDLGAAELAAWTSVARVILNLHETITRN